MKKNTYSRVEFFSLIGLVLAAFSLFFGTWFQRPFGPGLSGLQLWLNLRMTLAGPEVQPDAANLSAIYMWLSLLVLSLVFQVLVTAIIFFGRKASWWFVSLSLWALSLLSVGTLMLSYGAVVNGAWLMAVGCVIALGGELWVIYSTNPSQSNHARALPKAAAAWSAVLAEARRENIPVTVLAVAATPLVTHEEVQQLQLELRGRDLIYPVRDGLFILLWQTPAINANLIAHKLQGVLQAKAGRSAQIGLACFPADSQDILPLLGYAIQALQEAQQVEGVAIVPHSYPSRSDALTVLAPWESLLAEAGAAQVSIAILSISASRPLNVAEIRLIQKELRGRDRVSAFDNGCYVLLWKTTREGSQIVLAKIQDLLQAAGIESQAAAVVSPEDGVRLADLLAKF